MPFKVFHFHNGNGGGVLTVIRNLLIYRQHDEIENHVIYTINKDTDSNFKIPGLKGAMTEQVFYYLPDWNFYYTCRQLAKLLPDQKAVIVAHDWLELGMVSNLGLQHTVVQVLHGDFDYYYNLSSKHSKNVDTFICVSNIISEKLNLLMPQLSNNIKYLRFPVPNVVKAEKKFDFIRCAYFVRDFQDERKQAYILPLIEKELLKIGIEVEWHIAAGGIDYDEFIKFWGLPISDRIHFYGELNEQGISKLLQECNIMILPSLAEGFPVAVVESMKHGLVSLVSKWDGAVDELVEDYVTGFSFNHKDIVGYVKCLQMLANNRVMLKVISERAIKRSVLFFDPLTNTKNYEKQFIDSFLYTSTKKIKFKAYGSRLDQLWIPNLIVKTLRRLCC